MRKILILIIAALVASTITAAVRTADRTGAQVVWMSDQPDVTVLRGRGITAAGVESAEWQVPGGEIIWRAYTESTDEIGMHHVFYRQYFVDALSRVATEVVGGDVGIHFDRKGRLCFIGGTQFVQFGIMNKAEVQRSTLQAHVRGLLTSRPGFNLERIAAMTPLELASRELETALELGSDGSGSRFRYVWTTLIRDSSYEAYSVVIDAATGALVSIDERYGSANCSPLIHRSNTRRPECRCVGKSQTVVCAAACK